MKKLRNILRETWAFYTFFFRLEKKTRDIVFYSEDKASFTYFEGLVNRLINDEDLPVCYVTSDPEDPLFRLGNKNLRVVYINNLLFLFTMLLDSKLLIMTMPDLHQLHIRRSERGAHHVYMFHSMGSSFPILRYGAIFHYDTVFCAGPHHIEEIRKEEEVYKLKKRNVVEFGYYRLEKVRRGYDSYIKAHGKKPTTARARVLLGPTWGPNSILDLCGSRLIRALLEGGYEVIVRPHPMTRKTNPTLFDSLINEFKGNPNCVFEEDIASVDSLFSSDILICDWSGLTYEYALGTERPVLFIDVPRKAVNQRYRELGIEPIDEGIRHRIGYVLGVDEVERAGEAVARLVSKKEEYVREIRRAREEYVYNFGSSSETGAAFIKEYLAMPAKRRGAVLKDERTAKQKT